MPVADPRLALAAEAGVLVEADGVVSLLRPQPCLLAAGGVEVGAGRFEQSLSGAVAPAARVGEEADDLARVRVPGDERKDLAVLVDGDQIGGVLDAAEGLSRQSRDLTDKVTQFLSAVRAA